MTPALRFSNAALPLTDGPFQPAEAQTPGFRDELGERRLTLDPNAGASFEVLRIRKDWADAPGFEAALRARVDEVRSLPPHPSLGGVHSVERVDGLGLSLVSKHAPGRRLSAMAATDQGPVLALQVISAVTAGLDVLHRAGIAHGMVSAERVVHVGDGRLVLVEQVFGSALPVLDVSRTQFHALGAVVRDGSGPIRPDTRTDMIQLGFMALSLLLRRPLDPSCYPRELTALLDEFTESAGSAIVGRKMRAWLSRALQVGPHPFASATDALAAADDLPTALEVERAESAHALLAFPLEAINERIDQIVASSAKPATDPIREERDADDPVFFRETSPVPAPVVPAEPPRRRAFGVASVIIGLLSLVVIGEAVLIFLGLGRPTADVIEIRPVAVPTPSTLTRGLEPPALTPDPVAPDATNKAALAATSHPPAPTPKPAAAAGTAAGPKFGGMTVTSAIDLQVLVDGKLAGSTAGPMAVSEGAHHIELVNDALGFRLVRNIDIKNGQMAAVNVPVPTARISVNATPWAEVTIDGAPAGETPLASLSVPIGSHEIEFRHPQLGVRKQTVVVKVGAHVRVTQTFDRQPRP